MLPVACRLLSCDQVGLCSENRSSLLYLTRYLFRGFQSCPNPTAHYFSTRGIFTQLEIRSVKYLRGHLVLPLTEETGKLRLRKGEHNTLLAMLELEPRLSASQFISLLLYASYSSPFYAPFYLSYSHLSTFHPLLESFS